MPLHRRTGSPGTNFDKPAHYDKWEAEYRTMTTKNLRAADEPVNLSTVLREMRALVDLA